MSTANSTTWKNQKYLIIFFFLFTTFSGAIRKWFLPEGASNNLILLIQLFLPFIFLFYHKQRNEKTFQKFLFFYTLVLLSMAFNPLNPTIYHGFLGIVLHLGFWYLIGYYFNHRDSFALEKLINFFIIISILQISFAMLQYSLPSDHILNRYVKDSDEGISTVGLAVRVTGTFSYIGGFGAFMIFFSLLLVSLIKLNYNKILILIFIFLGFLGCLMNGSRAILILYITCLILSISATLILNIFLNLLKIVPVLIVFYFFLGGSITEFVSASIFNFTERVEETQDDGEQASRINGPIEEVINFRGDHSIFGVGLGSTYQGANALWGVSSYVNEYGGYEEEPERIILEGGYILFFLKIFLWYLFYKNSKIEKLFLFFFIFIIFFYFIYTFNIFNAIYIFFGLALLDRVYYKYENNSFSS